MEICEHANIFHEHTDFIKRNDLSNVFVVYDDDDDDGKLIL